VSKKLLADGLSALHIGFQPAKIKTQLGIVEPQDLISFPATLHDELVADLPAQIASEPSLTKQRLDERLATPKALVAECQLARLCPVSSC
jgi:hypothetical protein